VVINGARAKEAVAEDVLGALSLLHLV
jgi:hypothetical protein